jgi:hypothetical protein
MSVFFNFGKTPKSSFIAILLNVSKKVSNDVQFVLCLFAQS